MRFSRSVLCVLVLRGCDSFPHCVKTRNSPAKGTVIVFWNWMLASPADQHVYLTNVLTPDAVPGGRFVEISGGQCPHGKRGLMEISTPAFLLYLVNSQISCTANPFKKCV